MTPPLVHWQPTASLQILQLRARTLARIRQFFDSRKVLEVETPLLSAAANTDPQLENFSTLTGSGKRLYLNSSPEFAMKRLLAAGSGPIYQICKAFRQEESGRCHNPEFTLLEWYRPGFDHHQLMDEVEQLVGILLDPPLTPNGSERLAWREAFQRHANIDPIRADCSGLMKCTRNHGISTTDRLADGDREGWLDLLMTHVVQPRLGRGRLTFLFDYPASQAALSRIDHTVDPPTAERFELFLEGIELANGFHELTDSKEQRQRFLQDRQQRSKAGLPLPPLDENLLAALEHGLPDCSGVALGIDRLLMLISGTTHIDQVLSFPSARA